MFRRLFVDHPASMGESYLEHQGVALSFAGRLAAAAGACAIHALIPGLFVTAASRAVGELNDRLIAGGRRGAGADRAAPGLPYSI
ncbi:MAG: DUF6356 family protein [Caulobacteraceae bacterium]